MALSPRQRSRYGLLLLAVAVAVLVAVVAVKAQEPDPTSPGRETGSTSTEAIPAHVSDPTDRPYDEAFGWFEPIVMAGTGTTTIPLPEDSTAGIVTVHYENHGYIDVEFLFPRNRSTSLIATSGPYHGTVAYGPHTIGDEEMPDSLRVWATGSWEVTVAPLSSAQELPAATGGREDAVFLYSGDGTDWVLEHRAVLLVFQWGPDRAPGEPLLPWHEAPRHSHTVHLAPGPSVVTVESPGNSSNEWSASVR